MGIFSFKRISIFLMDGVFILFMCSCIYLDKSNISHLSYTSTVSSYQVNSYESLHTSSSIDASSDPSSIQVDSFLSLSSALENDAYKTVILSKDITVIKDLKILASNNQKRVVIFDLNGHTLFFENGINLFVNDYYLETQVHFRLTSKKKGGSLIFMYKSVVGEPGGIINIGETILDGNVVITTMNEDTKNKLYNESYGHTLIYNDFPNSLFIMNSGEINALGNCLYTFNCSDNGNLIINGGIIQNSGLKSIAIYNEGGKVTINNGKIMALGDESIAIMNEDVFDPLGNDTDEKATPTIIPDKDIFVMNGGEVFAEGNNSIAVSLEKNCTVSGGKIFAIGKNSTGIAYYFIGGNNINEKLNINLFGGHITGEGHALIDYRGKKAFYRNTKGTIVMVDSSIKEIKLD